VAKPTALAPSIDDVSGGARAVNPPGNNATQLGRVKVSVK
jgi:hypothetical protein